ncbi:SUR7/PalI family protein [Aspergillus fischeri NRRL 181]|uniref:Integral membrane protein n=1 Tax=Neosartorya fischeri (strain ATCC 1020 / DSM 3700 / CBS 544.65 / FGSC A1164 / JCM 1740 / NRRL 181 / WB 181) TaxID=331117 RepID=A1DA46_NEOFI|nr:uncharacterized protein NFIA_031100 [Aspergillus fischeri NRRL 181]EAW20677.1 hypothetical protein NFIA_031100 [Aspergillus fischeri NRRL 181]
MLRNTLKLLPLALSAAALICLAVVFEGCRSTSSPRDLFFLEVRNWTSLLHQRIVRSFSLSDQASNLSDSAHDALTHASSSLSDLRSNIWSTLPDYYAVGLWGYCSGEKGASKYSSCSTPTLSFSFDLVAILESNAPGAVSLLPEASKAVLPGLSKSSRLAVAAYIIGMAATTLTVVAELFTIMFKWGTVPTLICSLTNLLAGCLDIHCHCINYCDDPVQLDIWRDPNLSR